jgi:inositol phosphorylceramide mannosyltransferase catalytic subunit
VVILHQMWVGPEMPAQFADWGYELQVMHPDWEYRLWGDGDFGWLHNQDVYDRAEELVPDHKVGQLRSNVARYEILHRYGGVWLDADVEPLRPLDGLVGPQAWAGWERQDEWVGTSVMGGEAGAPFWEACIRGVQQAGYPGPQEVRFVTGIYRKQGGLHVYPEWTFYPYRTHDIGNRPADYGQSYVAHHWNHLRELRGVPL